MNKPKVGGYSPWGKIQEISEMGSECLFVYTASHGGIFVPDNILKDIPIQLREYAKLWSGSQNWYEEDECAAIPLSYLSLDAATDSREYANQVVARIIKKIKATSNS